MFGLKAETVISGMEALKIIPVRTYFVPRVKEIVPVLDLGDAQIARH